MYPHPRLLPHPRQFRLEGPSIPADAAALVENAVTGTGPGSDAWHRLRDLEPQTLSAGGYALRVEAGKQSQIVIAAADDAGVFHARATLNQLVHFSPDEIAPLSIRDWPELSDRGIVEGFYGGPWSHEDRLEFLRFAGKVKLNSFIYASKDEPYHRDRWRDLYPDDELACIAELAATAAENRIRFVYALAPALSMQFSDDAEHAALAAKAGQLWDAGVRSFALLFDDVPFELADPRDIAVFGSDAAGLGRAHGTVCARFVDEFLAPRGVDEPLHMCPTDYAGNAPSPYRQQLAATLPEDARVLWTGSDIVVGKVTRADIDAASASYDHDVVLWDNYPVNDFDRSRLFLGPLQGRTTDVAGSRLRGIASNPMVEAFPSQFALATAADWAWNPADYDPALSAGPALSLVAGQDAAALAPLVAASSAWPPSAPQSADLQHLAERASDGDDGALDALETEFSLLADTGGHALERAGRPRLIEQLEPWIASARDAGRAGVLACQLLRNLETASDDEVAREQDAVREARSRAEQHYPNVLRSVIPTFIRHVLERTGVEEPPVPARACATVLIGGNPAPGDRELSETLGAHEYEVTLSTRDETPETLEDADLVIVTRNASLESARAAVASGKPLIAWGHLEELGLASESMVAIHRESVSIADPEHPLAAGLSGEVQVYRGGGKLTWSVPSPDGEVIARALDSGRSVPEDGKPTIVHYRAGAVLPGGEVAPASRVAFFLGSEGFAPWLMSAEGRALTIAAVDVVSGHTLQEAAAAS